MNQTLEPCLLPARPPTPISTAPTPRAHGLLFSGEQEAGDLLSRAASVEPSDTASVYNAACAFALCGDENLCSQASAEYCRRRTVAIAAAGDVTGSFALAGEREAARRSLLELGSDRDFEGVRGAEWFTLLLRDTEAAL